MSTLLICSICFSVFGQQKAFKNKKEVIASVEKYQQELIQLNDQIWDFAETALLETNSAQVLADYAVTFRKLKNLGVTISLIDGYEVSPCLTTL